MNLTKLTWKVNPQRVLWLVSLFQQPFGSWIIRAKVEDKVVHHEGKNSNAGKDVFDEIYYYMYVYNAILNDL